MICPRCQSPNADTRTFCGCGAALPALAYVNLSPQATPSKANRIGPVARTRQPYNSWEAGRPVDPRPGGTAMPYLKPDGDLIGQKDWAQGERRKFQDAGLA